MGRCRDELGYFGGVVLKVRIHGYDQLIVESESLHNAIPQGAALDSSDDMPQNPDAKIPCDEFGFVGRPVVDDKDVLPRDNPGNAGDELPDGSRCIVGRYDDGDLRHLQLRA